MKPSEKTSLNTAKTLFKLIALATGAAGLAVVCSAGAASAACQLQQIAQYHVTMVDNQPLIDVLVDGHPVQLLVRTGSSTTFLWGSAARDLGLTVLKSFRTATFYGYGGAASVGGVALHELKLGDTVVRNYTLDVVDGGAHSDGAAGVLGADFLAKFDVEFDFAHGAMRLFQPSKDCAGDQVVYWGHAYSVAPLIEYVAGNQSMSVYVTLNGKLVRAGLNSGEAMSLVTIDAAARAGVTPHSEGVQPAGAVSGLGGDNSVPASVAVFPTLAIGDESIKNAKLKISDVFAGDKRSFTGTRITREAIPTEEMVLGADFFNAHRIYVARGQGKIYFSYAGGPIFQVLAANTDATPPAPGAPKP